MNPKFSIFAHRLAQVLVDYCEARHCAECMLKPACDILMEQTPSNVDAVTKDILNLAYPQKLDEEPYKDDYGDSDGRRV